MLRFTEKLMLAALALLFFTFITKPLFSAEKITEGMKQGEFAMLLIKELGAQGALPPAATTQDAFKFLEKLGLVPSKGWDEEGIVDSKFLAALLGLSEKEAAKFTFDELLGKLEQKLADILWSMGIRAVAPQTISPAGGS